MYKKNAQNLQLWGSATWLWKFSPVLGPVWSFSLRVLFRPVFTLNSLNFQRYQFSRMTVDYGDTSIKKTRLVWYLSWWCGKPNIRVMGYDIFPYESVKKVEVSWRYIKNPGKSDCFKVKNIQSIFHIFSHIHAGSVSFAQIHSSSCSFREIRGNTIRLMPMHEHSWRFNLIDTFWSEFSHVDRDSKSFTENHVHSPRFV